MSSGQHFEDTLKKQLSEKRVLVLDLEKELGKHQGEIATLKGKLLASENVRVRSWSYDGLAFIKGSCDPMMVM